MQERNFNSLFDRMSDAAYRAEFIAYKKDRMEDEDTFCMTREYIQSDRCVSDICRLKEGDYYFGIPVKESIPKYKSDRKRIIYRFADEETALMRLMAYALQEMDYLYTDGLYSFRRGKCAKDYFRKYRETVLPPGSVALKADVRSYGSSLDIGILTGKLNEIFRDDPPVRDFLTWLINRKKYREKGETLCGDTAGLPGCPVHSFFTNIYLLDADRYFQDRTLLYSRYSDDILMYVGSDGEARELYESLFAMISGLGLSMNEEKTGIMPADGHIEYLGMEMCGDGIDISPVSLCKLKSRMKNRAREIESLKRHTGMNPEEAGKRLIAANLESFFGTDDDLRLSWHRWAFPVITKTDGLRALDHYNMMCIRFVMTGRWGTPQYRVSYGKLKELGYRSLVREYYRMNEK